MSAMKDFDRRIRQGGDDAIAAVEEYVAEQERLVAQVESMLQRACDRHWKEWIPVEERLPEPGESVLMFFRATDADGRPSCIGYDRNGGLVSVATFERIKGQSFWTSDYGDETPSHWMPLPSPPDEAT